MLNVQSNLQHLEVEQIKAIASQKYLPFSVCCLNIEGRLNVSTIIRSAQALGAKEVIVFGRRRFDLRGCVGAQNYIPITKVSGLTEEGNINCELFNEYVHDNAYTPIFCEVGGTDYRDVDYSHISNPILVLGEEQAGIPEELLSTGLVVGIPMIGVVRSFNVGVAGSIIMEEVSRQLRG